MPRSYYNKMFKGLLPRSPSSTGSADDSGSDDGGATIRTTTRKAAASAGGSSRKMTATPYKMIKKAVKKAKQQRELREQERQVQERAQKLEAYRQASTEFLLKVKGGAVVATETDDSATCSSIHSEEISLSKQLAVDCQGRQWTTKPKIVQGEMKFTTPKRYRPQRWDPNRSLPELDESCASLHLEVPDFQDHSAEKTDEEKQQEWNELMTALVKAGLQDKAEAMLAEMEAAAKAATNQ